MEKRDVYIKWNELEDNFDIEIEGVKTFKAETKSDIFPKLVEAKEYLEGFGIEANVIDLIKS